MKILFLTKYVESVGGISGQVKLLTENLRNEGWDVTIFSTRGSVFKRITMFYTLRQVVMDYDVLHIHCCSYFGFFSAILGVTVAKRLGKRIICTYHGGGANEFFKKYPRLVKYYLSRTDENIVLSGYLAKTFDEYKLSYHIIPNILPDGDEHFRLRNEISPRFISVRSLQPLYNVQCIVKAFSLVKQFYADAELFILGDGECRKELEDLVQSYNINGVHFIGHVSNAEIYDYLDKADIFVSMPKIDNQPVSVLEAFKCGLLVISSNVGGVPYMVDNGRTGFLVESNNHRELAKRMIEAVKYPKKTQEMIRYGYDELAKYSWAEIKQKLFILYSNNNNNKI